MKYREAFEILAGKMDARQAAIDIAKSLKAEGKDIPQEFKHLERFFDEKPWRKDYKVIAKVRKSARKIARGKK